MQLQEIITPGNCQEFLAITVICFDGLQIKNVMFLKRLVKANILLTPLAGQVTICPRDEPHLSQGQTGQNGKLNVQLNRKQPTILLCCREGVPFVPQMGPVCPGQRPAQNGLVCWSSCHSGSENGSFGRGVFSKCPFLEILENAQTVENKGESDHFLESLENLEMRFLQ